MYELPKDQMSNTERAILRKLRVWVIALAVTCLAAGVAIGAFLSGHPAVAQNEAQVARAPEALSASFSDIAKRVEPAVVNIDTKTASREVADDDDDSKDSQSSTNPLLEMFKRRSNRPSYAVGSGFIVDPKGYILTNEHVVQGATRITVGLQSGEKFLGEVVGVDAETDVAVIRIKANRDLPTVKFGDSKGAQVGDWVLAIGSPFGLDQTVTAGIISTKDRQSPAFNTFQQFIQTDAAINRGNSGGPLVNMRGEVIGINSQIATSTGDYNGIGFALPSNEAAFVYDQIKNSGKVRRGYLGIYLDSVKAEFAQVYHLPEARGAVVTDIRDVQGPAGKAGIKANDVIVEFNDQPVVNAQDLINRVAATPVGQTVTLTYLRDSGAKQLERRTASVIIGERPASAAPQSPDDETPAPTTPKEKSTVKPTVGRLPLGITLVELTPALAAERSLTGVAGLLVKDVDPNGIAADARPNPVVPTDVITSVNRIPVATLAEFQKIVDALKPGDPVVLNITQFSNQNKTLQKRIVQFTYQ
jgi:serine protease Do